MYDTVNERSNSKLHEMVALGKDYREDMELEVFGGTVRIEHRALPDKEFLPLVSELAEVIDMEVDSSDEAIERGMEEMEEARTEDGDIDVTMLDDDFVEVTQRAAALGITASYDDEENRVPIDEDEATALLREMVGGISVEIGMQVLDTAGNIRDAELFR